MDSTQPSYAQFLAGKQARIRAVGPVVDPADIHPSLHPWQARIVAWAVRIGRAAIWADTGLGKTRMQLEWARLSGTRALIVAPLAVCQQTVREAAAIGINARYMREDRPGNDDLIRVTNYEMVDRFDPDRFDAVVLDEASILKQSDGKTRTKLIRYFAGVPRRLACTATPAPNDVEELTNQAEFLGVMARVEMLAAYFVHDGDGWRLKGHARRPMFEWMSTWAVAVRSPVDLGFPEGDYRLPGLDIIPELVTAEVEAEGQLFATDLGGVGGRARIRRRTIHARVGRTVEIVDKSHVEGPEPWVIWCGLNSEQDALAAAFGDRAVSVTGSMSPEEKVELLWVWLNGERPILLSKPSIFGMGLNFQHCARMAFVGLSDSYEAYYQAIRRCYRYGQHRRVRVHVVLSEIERQIAANVARKEEEAARTVAELVAAMHSVDTIGADRLEAA